MPEKRQITIRTEGIETRDLKVLTESELITTEQQRQLAVATESLPLLRKLGPTTDRHFQHIDTMLAIRGNAPISRALETLQQLDQVWDNIRGDFHRYREMFYEGRVAAAKLNKKRKAVEACDDEDEKEILRAEIGLEEAKLNGLETELANGKQKLEGSLSVATRCSEQYSMICKEAGVDKFTEEDFERERLEYYLKSAWWQASRVFRIRRPRPRNIEEARALQQNPIHHVRLPEEVAAYCQALGIPGKAVEEELLGLRRMRDDFVIASQGGYRDFTPTYDNWLARMAKKYHDNVQEAINRDMGRLAHIQSLIDPHAPDVGVEDYDEIVRDSMF